MEFRNQRRRNMNAKEYGLNLAERHLNILLVEDNVKDAARLRRLIEDSPLAEKYKLTHVNSLSEAISDQHHCDIVLLDLDLPDSRGLETVFKFSREGPDLPVVVFANLTQKRLATAAVPLWAHDYFLKEDSSGLSLANILNRAIEKHEQRTRLFGRRRDDRA
jgi:two-component system cell cycle response regulator